MILCLRGIYSRAPVDCDGKDCSLDIFNKCVEILKQEQEKRYSKICGYCLHFDKYECPKRNEVHRSAIWALFCLDFKNKNEKKTFEPIRLV